jgi:predicted Fe-Mo cluster-binding NifX family protein
MDTAGAAEDGTRQRRSEMRIAVTSTGKTYDSEVDQRFGRAQYFMVFDSETKEYKAIDNEINVNAMQGAGVQAGEIMSREGVQVLLTGHCGPKAFRTLQAAGITVVTGAAGTVEEAVKRYLGGEMTEAGGPDVQGHW